QAPWITSGTFVSLVNESVSAWTTPGEQAARTRASTPAASRCARGRSGYPSTVDRRFIVTVPSLRVRTSIQRRQTRGQTESAFTPRMRGREKIAHEWGDGIAAVFRSCGGGEMGRVRRLNRGRAASSLPDRCLHRQDEFAGEDQSPPPAGPTKRMTYSWAETVCRARCVCRASS